MIAGGVDYDANTALPGDVTNIQYTSGTTGAPKGVLLTHRNLVNNADLCGRSLGSLRKTASARRCLCTIASDA